MEDGKINILHITEPTIDGVKTHMVDLLSNLNTETYKITLLYSTERSDPKLNDDLACFEARGIQVFRCTMSGHIRPIKDTAAFLNVFRFIQKSKFDIVHCHSSKAGFLARVASRILHIPVVVYTPHAFCFLSNHGKTKRLFHIFLEKFAARLCDRIICVSQSEKSSAVDFKIAPESKFNVIPNAINSKKINLAKKINLREHYPDIIKNNDIIITTVGRLSYQKAPDLFVRAAAIVVQEFDHAKFLYIGQGELKKTVEQLALKLGLQARIIFTGYRNDVFDLLKSSHIFVLSSRYEGLPYSTLEAMALKLPVVATKVTGSSELIIDGKTGILVHPEDENEIANAIMALIKNPVKRKNLGLEGFKHLLENYDLDNMIRLTEKLYEDLFRSKNIENKVD